MLIVRLNTSFNIEVDFAISPFHKRLFAWIIDLVIMVAYIWGIEKLFPLLYRKDWTSPDWIQTLLGIPLLLYHLALETLMNGQSVGKKAMQIKVISADGGQPSFSQYLIRWMFRLADFPIWILATITYNELPWWCAIFLFSGLASVIITEKSQRLGDLLAGTIMIDTRNSLSWEDTVFTELDSGYQPRFPAVMKMSDKDINTLKSIIQRVSKKGDYDLSMRIGERIKSKLGIESDQDSLDFLETLLKDYNYYSTNS